MDLGPPRGCNPRDNDTLDMAECMPESLTVANPLERRTVWSVLPWCGAIASLAYLAWSGLAAGHAATPWTWAATAAALLWLGGCLLWQERRARRLRCDAERHIEHALSEAQTEYGRHVQQRMDTLNLEIETRKALDQKLQRTLDDLYQQLASQRDFLAMVSHEFRTPISIIDGARQSLELLDAGQEPQAVIRLERIRRAVQRMSHLVGGLQAADRLDKDSISLEFTQLSLAALTGRAIASIAPEHAITPAIRVDSLVAGDASLLEIAIANLVGNAVKYGGPLDGIDIEIYRDGDKACLVVMDRGPGLSDADLARLFERFYRGANIQNKPGTGLGLFLTQRIVEIHGGAVYAERRPGGGSVFRLQLPRVDLAGDQSQSRDRSTLQP